MAYEDVGAYPDSGGGITDSSGSTTDKAREQAGRVGQTAVQAGGEVAQTTREQARNVVGEARQQARDLLGEARGQVSEQAGTQKDRAVKGLHGLSDELDQMAGSGSGIGAEVARQVSSRTRDLAQHLDRHEPAQVLDQIRAYARRRPVVFLAGAALAGVLAGRLTRGLAAHDDTDPGVPALPPAEPVTDTFGTTATAYEPLTVEPAPVYDPTPTPTPAQYVQPYEPAPQAPVGGGFREPDEAYPAGGTYPAGEPYPAGQPYPAGEAYPAGGTDPAGEPYPAGQPYPAGEPYPDTPPVGSPDPAYDPDRQRGWTP
jgi:hypothetical protein